MSNLKTKRLESGLSQSQLSEKSGVNVRMIQSYEQGFKNIDHARLSTLLSLSAVLGCTLREILESEELIEQCKNADI